jgi:hypothetical protein
MFEDINHYDTQETNEMVINDEYNYTPEKVKLILKEKENPWYFNKTIINADTNQHKITGIIVDEDTQEIEEKEENKPKKTENKNYIFYIFCAVIVILLILLKIKKLSNNF